ncbi:MAG: FtsQ-type POTRA domain-containing protein, partial [Bifidobacteriales bacterium]|nr:FtsQ-type POTRA domain-containing protein [Bifidobacteriales bacterium]
MAVPATVTVSVLGMGVAQAAVVHSIEVHGNQRVDAQTIRDNTGIKVGKNFSNTDIDEGLKRLFAMGLFSDVKMKQVGSTLVVTVKEYEVVNQVLFQGNKKVKDPDLQRVISLKPREAFDPAKLASDEQAIRDAYRYVGRNDAAVSAQTVDLGQGRVNVIFKITEGKKTKIDDITFEGNKAFGNRRLRDVIATKRSNFLSWLTRGDVYSDDRLQADQEAL